MEKKRIVVTGINGFVGHHLAHELKENNISIIGIGHDTQPSEKLNDLIDEYHAQDLTEAWPNIPNVDGVIHLAGLAAVGPSYDDPQKYINMNSAMVTHMAEYYLKQEKKPRLLVVSSGAIYSPTQPLPINENGELGLTSPYAVSKVLTENQATYYRVRGLDCVVVRPFNHIGPGQAKGFILPDFYERIQNTTENVIKVGNINTKRDYTDVRDIVNAYTKLILAPQLQFTVYNVCSGRSLSGSGILALLKDTMKRPEIKFEVDPTLVRPTDIPEITGDSSRLQDELNWKPVFEIQQTVTDFINSQRS